MQTIKNSIKNFFKTERMFWSPTNIALALGLVLLLLFVRLYPIWGGYFPFQYDNAKDSLIMLEMWEQADPALVGPTTSIPGLFYGPAWYYLALPFNVLMDFHPIASVAMVLLLACVALLLLFRTVHPFAALLFAVSIGVIGTQQNAWTPYMTTLIMVPTLLLLLQIAKTPKVSLATTSLLALFVGLFFHFQVAYAVVFFPITLVLLLWYRKKLSRLHLLIFAIVFGALLLPSFVFELKHDFLQTRSVLQFIQDYNTQAHVVNPNAPGILRVAEIARYTLDTAIQAVSPIKAPWWIGLGVLAGVIVFLRSAQATSQRLVISTIIAGTFLLYLVLPAKSYYFVALFPVWIYPISKLIVQRTGQFLIPISVILITAALFMTFHAREVYQSIADREAILYATKESAINTVYQRSEGKPFAVYHFLPEVYDYAYQHIYLVKHRHDGLPLPVEFSFAPGETSYIPYKHVKPTSSKPEMVFLIVEPYFSKDVYDAWWQRVTEDLDIIGSYQVNAGVTIYTAVPTATASEHDTLTQ